MNRFKINGETYCFQIYDIDRYPDGTPVLDPGGTYLFDGNEEAAYEEAVKLLTEYVWGADCFDTSRCYTYIYRKYGMVALVIHKIDSNLTWDEVQVCEIKKLNALRTTDFVHTKKISVQVKDCPPDFVDKIIYDIWNTGGTNENIKNLEKKARHD